MKYCVEPMSLKSRLLYYFLQIVFRVRHDLTSSKMMYRCCVLILESDLWTLNILTALLRECRLEVRTSVEIFFQVS